MASQVPFSGATGQAGGFLIPDKQAGVLANGLLREAGALSLAGDARVTDARRERFAIWLGQPTAGVVGEGARKPVTGGELDQAFLNIIKVASIVLFTDEQREDIKNGDLDVLVDSGVRGAIASVLDGRAVGKENGADITPTIGFDTMLRQTGQTVEFDQAKPDALRLAVSAAMGKLEANGYGNADNMGVLLASDFRQHIRDARSGLDTTKAVYDDTDPLYGLKEAYSTNLNRVGAVPAPGSIVGFVVHRPNIHVRLRKDIEVTISRDATVNDGTTDRHLFQENLTALRYETRQGALVHDLNRAVVALTNAG